MKKILLGFIISFSAVNIYSQQLYVSEITVRQGVDGVCSASAGEDMSKVSVTNSTGARIEFDRPRTGYPAGCLSLCANITAVIQTTADANLGVDDLIFEIFKFKAGANPLDPSSTPPIRTISMHNVAAFSMATVSTQTYGPICTAWDGSYNIEGFWGKSNGQFGLRVKVRTNMVSSTAGNINIEQTSAFPGQNQDPITVDVTNIHVIKSTPTVVGKITGVGAQPYNILYRLSKDATVTIAVEDSNGADIRTIADSDPRFGEGIPDGTLTNGDFWDGRDNSGQLVQPGNYYVRINAGARDPYGWDAAKEYGFNLSLDPLQITDIAIKDLGPLSTDVAIISYQLTEDATVYLDIYPSGTTFDDINCSNRSTSCGPSNPTPLKTISSSMPRRQTVSMYWDGKNESGNYLCDGNYVFALSAVTKGRGGDLWTSRLGVGTVSIAKGDPLAFLTPSTTVIGSTPPAAGLNPFYFRYQLQRPATVKLEIKDMNNNIIRTLVNNEPRSSGLTNQESWDGKDSTGKWVADGTYRSALTITDPYVCMSGNIFTHDATFSSNLFRIVDVVPTSIIGLSTQAAISYQLSQSMWTDIKIYKQNVEINPDDWKWNTGVYAVPSNILYSISGMRPGRYRVTEYWDGRDSNGYMVEDGRYPFTIVAHSTGTQPIYATDKAYGYIDVSRGAIMFTEFNVVPTIADMKNSSDVVKLPPYEIDYSLTRQSAVTITITRFGTDNDVVARVVSGETRDPFVSYKDFWDGKCYKGNCDDGEWMIGTYNVNIYARDILANPDANITVSTVTMTIDNYPLRIYDLAIAPLTPDSPAIINYQLSEPMKVAIKIYKPGTRFIADEPICSPSEDACLVDTIIGIRPARTSITESWYGTAKGTGSPVPSGNYIFKIFGSTDTNEIDSITGNCPDAGCNSLAYDVMIQDLPVVKTYIEDPCKYFEDYSYFAPNPFNTPSGNFKLSLPMIGNVEIRVYNIAGDLVYSYKSSDKPGWGSGIPIPSEGGCITGLGDSPDRNVCSEEFNDPRLNWKKTNRSGRAVAPGLYIAVFKFQATQGSKELCQFKKKILIP
ncbi:MAG: hypothetical protein GX445_06080 [Elusimicrobia bacterium]|nr:hypothetical protein [Elusimicrobiota bacterium]